MQPDAKSPYKCTQKNTHSWKTNNDDQEFSLQLHNTTQEILNEQDYLSEQFNRCSYKLYKLWLALTLGLALLAGFDSMLYFYWIFRKISDYPVLQSLAITTTPTIISFLFLLLGCGQIFFAITKKSSTMAQRSVLNFQYSIIAAVFGSVLRTQVPGFKLNLSVIITTGIISLPILIMTHLLASFAVLKVFKKNNPLERNKDPPKNREGTFDQLESDFLEQNQAIALELWKYDEQLNRWPYLVYKFFLKLVVVSQIVLFSWSIIAKMIQKLIEREQVRGEPKKLDLISPVEFVLILLTFGLTAYCSYEMEIVLRTKALAKSKKTLVQIKKCICVAIIASLLTFTQLGSMKYFWVNFVASFGGIALAPILTFLGAFFANKIIEQRDQFVKVSSYNQECYV